MNEVVKRTVMIDMIMLIHVEDKKVILKEYLAAEIKLIVEIIERDLTKDLRGLKVVCYYKTSPFCRVANKIKKNFKHEEFRVSRKINDQGSKFYHSNKLEDEFSFKWGRI